MELPANIADGVKKDAAVSPNAAASSPAKMRARHVVGKRGTHTIALIVPIFGEGPRVNVV